MNLVMKRKRKREVHFTEKSAARVVAYARRDGASDLELARLLVYAFGMENIPGVAIEAIKILINSVFMLSLLRTLNGLLHVVKGIKVFVDGKISSTSFTFVEQFIRKFVPGFQGQFGLFTMWLGALETVLGTLTVLITSMIDQVAYYVFIDELSKKEIDENPFPITPPPIDFDVFYGIEEPDKGYFEQLIELTDTLFPDEGMQ